MNQQPNVVDELEGRLIATYYDNRGKPVRARRLRRWVPAAGSLAVLATIALVVVFVSLPRTVNPPSALAALDQAADAAISTPAPVLEPGKVWSAQVIRVSGSTQQLEPFSSNPVTVPITTRAVSDITITQSGRLTDRTVTSTSFVHPADTAEYGRVLGPAQVDTTTSPGSGKLASPLLPGQPLLSEHALIALPDRVSALKRVISRVNLEIFPQQASAATTTSPSSMTTTTSQSGHGVVRVLNSCCGASSQDRRAVGSMSVIAWLLALPVRPAVRAALYRTAATLPGVRYDGPVHDPMGRAGVEISIGTGDDQLAMIFNDHTSALLSISVGFGNSAVRQGFGTYTEILQSATITASK